MTRHAIVLSLLVSLVGACLPACGGSSNLGAPFPTFEAGIDAGPVLGDVQPTQVRLYWELSQRGPGEVELEAPDGTLRRIASPAAGTTHEVELTGLLPSTVYKYRLVIEGRPSSRTHRFETASDDPSAPVRFAVIGDMGCGCLPQMANVAGIEAANPDLVLFTGDVAYKAGSPTEVRARMLIPFANLMTHTPCYVALGNHDVATDAGVPTLSVLPLPRNDVDGSEQYYEFRRGCARFISINAEFGIESPDAPQVRWLRNKLAEPAPPWTITFTHRPPYTRGRHADHTPLILNVVPFLQDAGVDFMFSGHDHNYQRTHPIRFGVPIEMQGAEILDPPAPIYVVTGGGGNTLYPLADDFRLAFGEAAHHFTLVDITPATARIRAIRVDGAVIDDVTVRKTKTP